MPKENSILSVFNTHPEAEDTIEELQKAGYHRLARIIRVIVQANHVVLNQ